MGVNNTIDQSLWNNLRESFSEKEFLDIYEETSNYVWTICLRILKSVDDASEAFQGCYARFLSLVQKETKPPKGYSLSSLFHRMAVLEADRIRKSRSRLQKRERHLEDSLEHKCPVSLPIEMILQQDAQKKLVQLINELPDSLRIPITLHYLDGITQSEIANALGVTQSAINRRLKRGLKQLRPKCMKAGLGDCSLIFTALAGAGALLAPPSILTAESVYISSLSLSKGVGSVTPLLSQLYLSGGGVSAIKGLSALIYSSLIIAAIIGGGAGVKAGYDSHQRNQTENTTRSYKSPDHEVEYITTGVAPAEIIPSNAEVATEERNTPIKPVTTINKNIQIIWENSKEPVTGAKLIQDSSTEYTSDGSGMISLTVSSNKKEFTAKVSHPEAMTWEGMIPVNSDTYIISLHQPATLSGRVLYEESEKPAVSKVVRLKLWLDEIQDSIEIDQTTTNENGEYSFSVKNPGFSVVRANQGKYNDRTKKGWRSQKQITTQGSFQADPIYLIEGTLVSGTVKDEKGETLEGAEITYFDGNFTTVSTDKNGYYELEAAIIEPSLFYVIRKVGYVSARNNLSFQGEPSRHVDTTMAKGGKLTLKVLDDTGTPLKDIYISKSKKGKINIDSITDSGELIITDISKSETDVLKFSKNGYQGVRVRYTYPENVEKDRLTVVMKLDNLKSFSFIGKVLTENGQPIEGAEVSWGHRKERSTLTNSSGEYRLIVSNKNPERVFFENTSYVFAVKKGYASQPKQIISTGSETNFTNLDLQMKPGNWIELVILDEEENPIPDLPVTLNLSGYEYLGSKFAGLYYGKSQDGRLLNGFYTSTNGVIYLEDLPESNLVFGVRSEFYSLYSETLLANQHHDIILHPRGVILLELTDSTTGNPLTECQIELFSNDFFPPDSFEDKDGIFVIKSLDINKAKSFTIRANGYHPKRMENIKAQRFGKEKPVLVELVPLSEKIKSSPDD